MRFLPYFAPDGSNGAAPVEEEEKPEGQTPVEAEVKEGEETPAGEVKPAEEEDKTPPKTPWFTHRIDELTRNWREEERRRIAAEQELAKFRAGQKPPQEGTQRPATAEDIDRLAMQKAALIAETKTFNDRCNEAYAKGKEEFQDWDSKLANFVPLGGLSTQLVQAALETGEAHKVLHHLGGNMDEAARVMSLPPLKMAVELARIAAKASQPSGVSRAPAPVRPLRPGSKAEPSIDDDNLSTEEWMALREKTLQKKSA